MSRFASNSGSSPVSVTTVVPLLRASSTACLAAACVSTIAESNAPAANAATRVAVNASTWSLLALIRVAPFLTASRDTLRLPNFNVSAWLPSSLGTLLPSTTITFARASSMLSSNTGTPPRDWLKLFDTANACNAEKSNDIIVLPSVLLFGWANPEKSPS